MTDQTYVNVDATLYWPFLVKTNDLSGKYQVDVGNLSKEDAKKIAGLGANLKTEQKEDGEFDRGTYITCKSAFPITNLKWKNKEKLTEDQLSKLGNGTKVRLKLSPYQWEFKKKTGISMNLAVGVVMEYVEYITEVDDSDLFEGIEEEEDGLDDEVPF